MWLVAGVPDLFRLLRSLEHRREEYRELGLRLADRIGAELVPDPVISAGDRKVALDLRRQLHNGRPVAASTCRRVADAGRSPTLRTDLELAATLSADLHTRQDHAATVVADEEARLIAAPWQLFRASWVGNQALEDGSLPVSKDFERPLSRRLRKESDYLWRIIDRAAAKTVPRAWFGHVALLLVGEAPRADHGRPTSLRSSPWNGWRTSTHSGATCSNTPMVSCSPTRASHLRRSLAWKASDSRHGRSIPTPRVG